MKRLMVGIIMSVFLLSGGLSAMAVTETTTMNVSAQVPVALTVSATDLNFGQLSFTSPTTGTATISVTAADGVNFEIAIDAGANGVRAMGEMSSGYAIYYQLYQDSAYTTIWGDSCLSSPTYPAGGCVTSTGDGTTQTFTVYGQADQVPPGFPSGTYGDTLTVTVSY